MKKEFDARWSKTHRAWHVADNADNRKKLSEIERKLAERASREGTAIAAAQASAQKIAKPAVVHSTDETPNVVIEVLGRKLLLKMPKRYEDVKFVLSLRYARWNKADFLWEIPNYPGNLDALKAHFAGRLARLTEHEML